MRGILRKAVTAVLAAGLLLAYSNTVRAAEAKLTYGVEYAKDQTVITLYLSRIDAFDIGLIYDPSKVHVDSAAFTTEFKKLQANRENTTISICNDDAVDEAGNTYVVLAGAGTGAAEGGGIDFSGQPLAKVAFSGDLAGASVILIKNSAAEENVMKAEEKETITLGEQEGTVITPEPDVQAAPVADTAEDDSVTGAESAQNAADDAAGEAPETEETTQSEPVTETETEASAAEDAADPGEDSEVRLQDDEDTEIEEEKKAGKGRLSAVFGVIGGLILAAAAAVSVLLWRKKNPKQ